MQDFSIFRNKKILITGGIGFIGSNLAIRLVELGSHLTLVDSLIPNYGGNLRNIESIKDKVKINISDVRDTHSMKYLVQDHDFLFNLAGQTSHLDSMEDPYTDLEINTHAQLSILEACRHYNPDIKIVFASTRQIYGKPKYLPVNESHPLNPVDVNGINKLAGEQYHLLYNNIYNIRSCILRLTNTYGPRMRIRDSRQTFLGIWIRNLIEGKPIIIFGDGSQIRDFNFVEDVVDAFLMAAQDDLSNGKIYNLGARDKLSLTETARLMVSLNKKGVFEFIPFPENRKNIDIGDYWADFGQIEQNLGWTPTTPLEVGLQTTLAFFKQNISDYR
ncbi:MAG: NAD-dependent epimerase/dehydratase family protein [Chloroflexi bacterium]|nr:NAD-dependent epimerase/dehydratase family protein [Chloroflexota bacterium]